MNSIYNHGLKEINNLKKDLSKFESSLQNSILQNTISVNLSRLNQTIYEYETLIRNQPNDSNEDPIIIKAKSRLNNFQTEQNSFIIKFNELKQKKKDDELVFNRSELLHRNVTNNDNKDITNDNPYHNQSMNEGLLKENDILKRGNQQLDEILEMGRESLEELISSNEIIRNFQNKVTSSLDTLGVSQQTIRIIEKRAFQDKWIFYFGAFLLFIIFYYLLKWLR